MFNCQFANTGTVCRTPATSCDIPETCPGDSDVCPPDVNPACTATATPTQTSTPTLTPTQTTTPAPGPNDCCACGSFCAAAAGSCGLCDTVFNAACQPSGGCATFTPTRTSTPTSTPTPSFTWTAGPSPTNTGTPTNTPTPTVTATSTNTGTPTSTPTPYRCCQCPQPACGPPITPGTSTCADGCTYVQHGVCVGSAGQCLIATPTNTITRTFTRTPTPTSTFTRTSTATATHTPLLGEFFSDSFKCYRARPEETFTNIVGLTLIDEFDNKEIKLMRPLFFCTPADVEGQGIKHPDEFLMCFKIRQTIGQPLFSRKSGLIVRNQFGDTFKVEAIAPGMLCVPSRLAVGRVPTGTPTTAPTPAATATP